MKLIVAFFLVPALVFGQRSSISSNLEETQELLTNFLKTENSNFAPSTVRVTRFIEKLSDSRSAQEKNQQRFLHQLFVKTHSRFLRTFNPTATFSQIFSNGNYNCLTATALLGATLQHFGYSFRMIETNHHIFMLVQTDQGETLLETTDPIRGFITDPRTIARKIAGYKSNADVQSTSTAVQYSYQNKLFKEVSIKNIQGLLHFNLAVNSYNAKDYESAVSHLEKAERYYESSRLTELCEVIILTVEEQNVRNATSLVTRLNKIIQSPPDYIASVGTF